MSKYKIITPTKALIEQYDGFWTKEINEWKVQLFEVPQIVVQDIREYIPDYNNENGEPYVLYGAKDDSIKGLYENDDIIGFLKEINAVYHTRVPKLDDLKIKKPELIYMANMEDFRGIDAFVRVCHKVTGRNEYSFATKVFSFIDDKKYPILDSLVATMIWEYLKRIKLDYPPKNSWGDYRKYVEAYKIFIDQYLKDSGFTYKQIDRFLWTYAIVINEYWKKELGLISFESIPYKPK